MDERLCVKCTGPVLPLQFLLFLNCTLSPLFGYPLSSFVRMLESGLFFESFFFQLILVCFITCTLSKKVIYNTALPSWLAEKLWLYEALPRSSSFLQKCDILLFFLIQN